MDFAEDANVGEARFALALRVGDQRQGLLDGFSIAAAHAQKERRQVELREDSDELVRQRRKCAAFEGFLEGGKQEQAIVLGRRSIEKLRTDEEVGPRGLGREAAYQARKDVLPGEGGVPERVDVVGIFTPHLSEGVSA